MFAWPDMKPELPGSVRTRQVLKPDNDFCKRQPAGFSRPAYICELDPILLILHVLCEKIHDDLSICLHPTAVNRWARQGLPKVSCLALPYYLTHSTTWRVTCSDIWLLYWSMNHWKLAPDFLTLWLDYPVAWTVWVWFWQNRYEIIHPSPGKRSLRTLLLGFISWRCISYPFIESNCSARRPLTSRNHVHSVSAPKCVSHSQAWCYCQ